MAGHGAYSLVFAKNDIVMEDEDHMAAESEVLILLLIPRAPHGCLPREVIPKL